MPFKIYTKTGDGGSTSLYGGAKISKSDIRVEVYGTVDELNSYIGYLNASLNDEGIKKLLYNIQNDLFVLGSYIAADPSKPNISLPPWREKAIEELEKQIDLWDTKLEPLKNFILPGGSEGSSRAHLARTVCRRAERILVLLGSESTIPAFAVPYLNRLSDTLFCLARYINFINNVEDILWSNR